MVKRETFEDFKKSIDNLMNLINRQFLNKAVIGSVEPRCVDAFDKARESLILMATMMKQLAGICSQEDDLIEDRLKVVMERNKLY